MLRVLFSVVVFASVAGCGSRAAVSQKDQPEPTANPRSVAITGDDVRPAPRVNPGKGKKVALLVGVREYAHKSLSSLTFTENDAEGLASVLGASGFDEIIVLTTTRGDKDDKLAPTRENIERELKRLLSRVGKHDLMLVGLSGHGAQYRVRLDGKDTDQSFFCPADARLASEEDEKDRVALFRKLKETMLSFRDLFKQLDDSDAGTKLLLIDACRNDVGAKNADTATMPPPTKGTAALFACKGGERAFEVAKLGKGHGVFFYYVIEALSGKAVNKRGEVTWDRLTAHVREEVPEAVRELVGGGARQTPHLLANVEGDPVLRVLPKKHNRAEEFKNAMKDASAAIEAKKYDEAVKAYGRALKAKPGDAEATKGLLAAEAAMKKPLPKFKVYRVKSPIGEGILLDDDDKPIVGISIQQDDKVQIIDWKDGMVKIEVGRRSGWLTIKEKNEYLEEER